ncbi:hypothetical protein HPB47_006013 [Ixodes persulcatus]|uniref:Uncharacterized protein n=1 Tax=Ixodes persulcatus TaxID=34615 RepID=A0AC60PBE8_IXOPE|nr:hypothetical protein HPB47_006013 [Ixodes persulcatus]
MIKLLPAQGFYLKVSLLLNGPATYQHVWTRRPPRDAVPWQPPVRCTMADALGQGKAPSRRRAFDSGPAAVRHRSANIRDPLKYAVPRAGSARRAGAAERPGRGSRAHAAPVQRAFISAIQHSRGVPARRRRLACIRRLWVRPVGLAAPPLSVAMRAFFLAGQ